MSALEWIQSFEGITTISIGGLSLTTIVGFLLYAWKTASKMKNIGELVGLINQSKKMIEEEKELVQKEREQASVYKKISDEKSLQLENQAMINNLLLKGMSIVIAASGGIDTVSKVDMINDMKKMRDVLEKRTIESAKKTKEIVEETEKEVEVKVMEAEKEVEKEVVKVLDDSIKEAAVLVDKYSKR
ncbi:MAG: hypothetical protein EOM19_01480 [Candidatus Moranbacteria bacterium]|nr:hypothetical protein [Candidatus Moranbacteria bacterium]